MLLLERLTLGTAPSLFDAKAGKLLLDFINDYQACKLKSHQQM